MKYLVIIFALIFSTTAFSVTLEERVSKLEEDIDNLTTAISLLVLANANKSEEKADKFEPQGEGWRDIRNWRKLQKGMPSAQVTSILGEPKSINSGTFTFWRYQSLGEVTFLEGVVYGWNEPRF